MKAETGIAEYQHLVEIFAKRQGAVFCGAGISLEPPAGLPDWNKLRDYTLEAIASRDEFLLHNLDKLTSIEMIASPGKKGMTPELVASEIEHNCQGYFESFRSLEDGDPNANHRYLAKMAKAGIIHVIITTNFDLFLEKAFEQEGLSYKVYRTKEEFESFEFPSYQVQLHLLKLHGCISIPTTITATVEQEGRGLPPFKARVLEQLLPNYHFIFWGYSGADLKIDLDYLRMKSLKDVARGFVWNFFQKRENSELPNPYVIKLQELYEKKGIIVHGLLPQVFDEFLAPADRIEQTRYTDFERKEWIADKNARLQETLRDWADQYLEQQVACYIFSKLFLDNGQMEAALGCYKHMAEVCRERGEREYYGQVRYFIGDVYKQLGQHLEALLYYKEAEQIARETGDDLGLFGTLSSMGDIYSRWGNFEDALSCYKEAQHMQIDQQAGLLENDPKLLESIGDVYRDQGKLGDAFKQYQEAESRIRAIGFKDNLSTILDRIGQIHLMWGEYEEAFQCFQEAEATAAALGLKTVLGNSRLSIGSIYWIRGEYELALKYFQEAEHLAQEIGDNRLLCGVYGYIGSTQISAKKYEEALLYLGKAEQLAREIGERRNVALILGNIAVAHGAQGKYEVELKKRQESLAILEAIGDRTSAAQSCQSLGFLYQETFDRPVEAIAYYQRSLSYYHGLGLEGHIPEVLQHIAACQQMISGEPVPSLFDILSEAVRKEEVLHEAITFAARNVGIQSDPLDLRLFCDIITQKYGREDSIYTILLVFGDMGDTCRANGESEKALRYNKAAVEIASQIGDRYTVSALINNAGLIYADQGKYEEALKLFQTSEQIIRDIDDKKELITRLNNIAGTYEELGRIEEALTYFVEAEQVIRHIDDPEALSAVLNRIADIYKLQKRYEPALQYYHEAEQIARDRGDLKRLQAILISSGKVNRDAGKYEDAVNDRKEAVRLLEANGDINLAASYSWLIANLYEKNLDQPEAAIPYYEKCIKLYHQGEEQANINIDEVQLMLEACRQKISK
ncbi:MAG: tetratricopeptide repeat protein [Ktedonobacteraceae bacterium]